MFEIWFGSFIAFFLITVTVAMFDDMCENQTLTNIVAGVGYTGLGIGFICALVKMFLTIM